MVVVGMVELLVLGRLPTAVGFLPMFGRCAVAILVVAPLAVLMGLPMPLALSRLERAQPALIPWAWGINGFASVLAAPLATVIGMTWGFTAAGAAALALYVIAAAVFARLPATN